MRVRGAGTFKDQPKTVELPQVTLRAVRPFAVSATYTTPSGPTATPPGLWRVAAVAGPPSPL